MATVTPPKPTSTLTVNYWVESVPGSAEGAKRLIRTIHAASDVDRWRVPATAKWINELGCFRELMCQHPGSFDECIAVAEKAWAKWIRGEDTGRERIARRKRTGNLLALGDRDVDAILSASPR